MTGRSRWWLAIVHTGEGALWRDGDLSLGEVRCCLLKGSRTISEFR